MYVAARRRCCHVRKVEPLTRALKGVEAWVTGQRRAHGPTRAQLEVIELDAPIKLNPLAHWSHETLDAWVAKHQLPQNPLIQRGFASIGCAPCTRAIQPGEPERAGRWWWEAPEHKECGLHGRVPWLKEAP